jgi:hypothetical protein
MFLTFLWGQGLRWSLAGLEIIILIAAAGFQTIYFDEAAQKQLWLLVKWHDTILPTPNRKMVRQNCDKIR